MNLKPHYIISTYFTNQTEIMLVQARAKNLGFNMAQYLRWVVRNDINSWKDKADGD